MVERAKERIESMKELPSSAAALQRALVLLDEPLCTNKRLERVLASDQGAVTGLLRLANSAYFGVPGEVSSAATAIRVVGHRRLRALLCHLIAGKLFEILRLDVPIVDRVRRKALAAAVVCADIGAITGDAEELRVAGLLHNVGELALAAEFPKEFGAASDPVETFGIRYEGAGFALLKAWRMPEAVAEAALHWRTSMFDEERRPLQRPIDAVHVGASLAEAWVEGQTPETASGRLLEEVLERLALPGPRIEALYGGIAARIQQLEAML